MTSRRSGYRKIPDLLRVEINSLFSLGKSCIFGRAFKLDKAEIEDGSWGHLNFELAEDNRLVVPSQILPPPKNGRWSGWNINGRVIIRKDLPKVSRDYSWESPNFGDWSKGSHSTNQSREVWQREIRYGKSIALRVEVLSEEHDSAQVRVFWPEEFRQLDEATEFDILLAASVLRENVGTVSVFDVKVPGESWIAGSEQVNWEILPPGEEGESEARKKLGIEKGSPEDVVLMERFEFINQLNPVARITGTSGFARYFGAKFSDELVIFENIKYGNAIYVMFANWKELSRLSRLELLSGQTGNFVRVVHRGNWKNKVRVILDGSRR